MHIRRMRDFIRTFAQALRPFLFRIVQFPRYGVKQPDQTGFADAPAEQGIGS